MFVVSAAGKLPRRATRNVRDENVQPLVVVEPGVPLRRGRFVEITRDDDGVTACIRRLRTGLRGNISDLLAIGRPGDGLSRGRKRRVGAFQRTEVLLSPAVRPSDNQSGL